MRFLSVMSVLMVFFLPFPLQAQSSQNGINKRIDILERQLRAVQRKVFSPGSAFGATGKTQSPAITAAAPSGSNIPMADIEARLSQLETQLRQLTGRLEESSFQVDSVKQQLETMARDYEFRFGQLEKAPMIPSAAPAAVAPGVGGTVLPEGSAEEQYRYAQRLVTKGNYDAAETALETYIKRYPKSDLAGNAQYWLGQTFYVRQQYVKATRTFLEGYNSYPKSRKAPAFLLKIGMSLNAMGEKTDACDAYRELQSRFPDSVENKNNRPAEEKRAGCR